MLNRIISWSLEHRLPVVVLAAALMTLGLRVVRQMPVDVLPEFVPPQVIVHTEAPGMSPAEVESLIALPLETAINGASGLQNLRSTSSPGLSVITATFDWDTDIFKARQLVTERIQTVAGQVPPGAEPFLLPIASPIGIIMNIGLVGEGVSSMDLQSFAQWVLRPRLFSVPGVASVVIFGGDTAQFQVLVSPEKLKAYGITLEQVYQSAARANVNAPGGFTSTSEQQLLIRGLGRIRTVEDLADSLVNVQNGVPITLKQVATVQLGPAVKVGDASINGKPGVLVVVRKQPGADTVATIAAVNRALDEIQLSVPEGVKLDRTLLNQGDFIQVAIHDVNVALLEGGIIVAVILLLFLFNLRTAFISFVAIPLSLIIGAVCMKLFGVGINTMTLGGLAMAIGEVVDDAIIDVENVFRRLRENNRNPLPKPFRQIVFEASVEVRGSVVYATFVVALVFLPIFVLTGVEGRIFRPLGMAYVFSLMASLLVALTLTPVLCALLLTTRRSLEKGESPVVRWLHRQYGRVLRWALGHRGIVYGVTAVLLLAALACLPFFGREFLPEFNEGNWIITARGLPGQSLEETLRVGKKIQEIVLGYPEVVSVAQRAGRARGDEDAQGVEFSELDVNLRSSGTSRLEVLRRLQHDLADMPGQNIVINQFITERMNELLAGARAPVAVRIFGPDLDVLRNKAQEVASVLASVPGASEVQVEQLIGGPELIIRVDRAAAARAGLDIQRIADFVEIGLNGKVASRVVQEQKMFDLLVRLDEKARADLTHLQDLLIDSPTLGKMPLRQVATVSFLTIPRYINHENGSRRLAVTCSVRGRDLVGFVEEARRMVAAVQLSPGYYVDFGGQFESQQRASREILVVGVFVGVGVFLLLAMGLRSAKLAWLVLANVPLALIGGVFSIFFSAGVISVASLIGFVSLFGIATRNGIMLITHYQKLTTEGLEHEQVVIQGARDRVVPILMTAATAGLALLPLALGKGVSGRELEQPLAVVIVGGLTTSTFLNLVLLPLLYDRFGRERFEL
ncbi:MAG: efflux RND transporter permease subunit [Acidobacteria bacterium]|nr:efflux RND transporter permease subunit [Acidobacteriota bacterium]